jgi:hypothetical protein
MRFYLVTLATFIPMVALAASQVTIDTVDVNVNEANAARFLGFLSSHENKIVGLLKARLWPDSGFHVDLKGENLSAYVSGGTALSCEACAYYYQTAAVLDGYYRCVGRILYSENGISPREYGDNSAEDR